MCRTIDATSIARTADILENQQKILDATERKIKLELQRIEKEQQRLAAIEKTKVELIKQRQAAENTAVILKDILAAVKNTQYLLEGNISSTLTAVATILPITLEVSRILIQFLITGYKSTDSEKAEVLDHYLQRLNLLTPSVIVTNNPTSVGSIQADKDVSIKTKD